MPSSRFYCHYFYGNICHLFRLAREISTVTNAPKHMQLVPVDASNWRDVAAVKARPEQERFVATVTYYLAPSHYDGEWNPPRHRERWICYGSPDVGHRRR
jgi:hypothetical protein